MKLFIKAALCGTLLVTAALLPAPVMAEGKKPSVEYGKKLFSDPSLGTNGSSCATCHPSEEKVAELAARKQWFGGKAKTLEQAINICITGPLAGKPLPEDSAEARSIAMYMKSLTKK
jgi:cytochrome c peroxidase